MMEQTILEMLVGKETVFFALFLYLFWMGQMEKKEQNLFITKQQNALVSLTKSFEKLSDNLERLTQRIEKIEINVDKLKSGDDDGRK